MLRQQPGFLDDMLLEQHSGPGRFNAVTVVRWASEDALAGAKAAVDELHRADGFRPAEFFRDAGIEADVANYVDLPR
ncbi:hypothetical protein LY12_001181 [Prauserella alba]|nr:hypothetical protein [Prauserella alba]